MKKFFIFLLLAVVVASAASLKENEAEVVFKTDIESKHCKNRVENALAVEKGVVWKDLDIKIPEGRVYIKFRSDKTSAQTLKKTIENLGYKVELSENQPPTK
jgi:copper chaperone CopZ